MKIGFILQIVFDIILIVLNGYLGFTSKSIYLFVAFLWCIWLLIHILLLNRFKSGEINEILLCSINN